MELTRKGDYATRVVLDLAGHPPGTVVGLQEVGKRQGIPRAYLFKIVQALANAGLVRTFRGVGGGARLERPSAEVTLRQVIEAVEGPIVLNRCVLRAGECPRDRICPVHRVWHRIQGVLIAELEAVNFAGLVGAQMPFETGETHPPVSVTSLRRAPGQEVRSRPAGRAVSGRPQHRGGSMGRKGGRAS